MTLKENENIFTLHFFYVAKNLQAMKKTQMGLQTQKANR